MNPVRRDVFERRQDEIAVRNARMGQYWVASAARNRCEPMVVEQIEIQRPRRVFLRAATAKAGLNGVERGQERLRGKTGPYSDRGVHESRQARIRPGRRDK
jgi:hypothetical protein